MELMADPEGLAQVLKQLHDLRVLEYFVPPLTHARSLLQFNEYHKYTVDAHSIVAVQAVTDLRHDTGVMGDVYRAIDNPGLLHLTLLLHDLGKGFEEDHSELGRRLAAEVGERLHLPTDDIQLMQHLIHKHLRLADVAHQHDLNSRQIIEDFAREVGSVRALRYLVVHTIADLTAVGPGVLSDWKRGLIAVLFQRTLDYLQSGKLPGDEDGTLTVLRGEITKLLPTETPKLIRECLADLPAPLLRDRSAEAVAEELKRIFPIAEEKPRTVAWGEFDATANAVNYTIVNRQVGKPIGTFARATGALASQGLEILRAEINTIAGSVAWDCFTATDSTHAGIPGPARIAENCQAVIDAFDSEKSIQPKFRKFWKALADRNSAVAVLPTRVEFDNQTSPVYSVISVFAYDRPGLLYDIARVLAEFEVVIHFAKIATHFDQARDMFYVSELDGSKLTDASRQQQIRAAMFDAIGVSGTLPAHQQN
jgi:[protein-PII] uridylyltransferase